MEKIAKQTKQKMVSNRRPTIAVIGLGRVGLPFSFVLASAGNMVYGVDKNQKLISCLLQKHSPFYEPGLEELLQKYVSTQFIPTTDLVKAIHEAQTIVLMVGIGLTQNNIDTSSFDQVINQLSKNLTSGKTIILRTTATLGTTDRVRTIIEQATNLKEGRDFWLAFVPERIIEGKAIEECRKLPLPVGTYSNEGFYRVKALFDTVGNKLVRLGNPKEAELVKLVDNAYRNMLFAFSNEVALLAENQGIDGIRVINAANYEYSRNHLCQPSYGVSGYCLSKDPYFFEHAFESISKERGFHSISYYARRSNDYVIERIYNSIVKYAHQEKLNNGPTNILVAGLSFKEDVDDFRQSHGLELIRYLLKENNFSISIYDPYLKPDLDNLYCLIPQDIQDKITIYDNMKKAIINKDVVVFTVKHKSFIELAQNGVMDVLGQMNKPGLIIDSWTIFTQLHQNKSEQIMYMSPGRSMNV